MFFKVVVDSGVHLRGEVGQQKRVVAQLELVVVREQWLKFGDVERIYYTQAFTNEPAWLSSPLSAIHSRRLSPRAWSWSGSNKLPRGRVSLATQI